VWFPKRKWITVFFLANGTENWHVVVSLFSAPRSTVAGGEMYAGQQLAAGDMYRNQPAMSAASYQGYVISKDAVNAAAAAQVPPVSSM